MILLPPISGNFFQLKGQFSKAEEQYNRALMGREKILGPDHVLTVDVLYNLGAKLLSE